MMISAGSAFAQSSAIIEIDLTDLKEMDRRLQENEILKKMTAEQSKTITELDKSLALTQKELDLERRENRVWRDQIVEPHEWNLRKEAFCQRRFRRRDVPGNRCRRSGIVLKGGGP